MEILLLFISISVAILMQFLKIFLKVLCVLFCFKNNCSNMAWKIHYQRRWEFDYAQTYTQHSVESHPNCKKWYFRTYTDFFAIHVQGSKTAN